MSTHATPTAANESAAMDGSLHELRLSWQLAAATPALLPQIHRLEDDGYAADEACSLENFRYRMTHATPFFKVAVARRAHPHTHRDGVPGISPEPSAAATSDASDAVPPVLGFVVGTLSASSVLRHDSMFGHDPSGEYLCIHSVCVARSLMGQGLGRAMLRAYVSSVAAEQRGKLKAILLICKRELIHFYQSCGFELVGPSDVVHGKEPWFECRMKLE